MIFPKYFSEQARQPTGVFGRFVASRIFEQGNADLRGSSKALISVNTIYFWKDPDATISRICRLLKPGGRLLVGFHDASEMKKMRHTTDVFRYYTIRDVTELLPINRKPAIAQSAPSERM